MPCAKCVPEAPPSTIAEFDIGMVEIIVDDSHLIVSIRCCEACGQHFVWVMTEIVDYEGGNDSQVRSILPLTDEEAVKYRKQGEALDLLAIAKLADSRTYLRIHDKGSGIGGQYMTKQFLLRHD